MNPKCPPGWGISQETTQRQSHAAVISGRQVTQGLSATIPDGQQRGLDPYAAFADIIEKWTYSTARESVVSPIRCGDDDDDDDDVANTVDDDDDDDDGDDDYDDNYDDEYYDYVTSFVVVIYHECFRYYQY